MESKDTFLVGIFEISGPFSGVVQFVRMRQLERFAGSVIIVLAWMNGCHRRNFRASGPFQTNMHVAILLI